MISSNDICASWQKVWKNFNPIYRHLFWDTTSPLSVWIRLKWDPLCLLRAANGQLSDRDSDTGTRISVCSADVWCPLWMSGCEQGPMVQWPGNQLVFCHKRRLPTPGREHDIPVHLAPVTITDWTMNWNYCNNAPCGQLSPRPWLGCGDQVCN